MRYLSVPLWMVAVSVIALTACDRTNDRTAAQRDETDAVARADRPMDEGYAAERPTGAADQRSATQPADAGEQPPDADDTGINTRDREDAAVTPMDQGNDERDLEVTREIRQAITDDDSLSTNAQNVKVITQGGVVVLRGPVENEQEKATIVSIATRTAGVSRVDDQLEIARD